MIDIFGLSEQLKEALAHLYDPVWLRSSPLIAALGLQDESNPPQALRTVLEEAIDALRPAGTSPSDSRERRNYHILFGRYVQQFTQRDIANQLGVSTRHLRRQQDEAITMLALNIQERVRMAQRFAESSSRSAIIANTDADLQAMSREMDWLSDSMADEVADLSATVAEAQSLAQTLAHRRGMRLQPLQGQEHLQVAISQTVLKEAILAALTAIIQSVPHGTTTMVARQEENCVTLRLVARPDDAQDIDASPSEGLAMASKLVQVFGGQLQLLPHPGALAVCMRLPSSRVHHVLAIEDNLDTLQLWERYLYGTRFQLVGTTDPLQAMEKALATRPDVIILDLMMPGIDGWELLGRLRNHPRTGDIPIIVCTVLPQEELALSLGASAFMRKPVTRQALRGELAHQTGAAESASPPEP
jgi:CheY-like chemotaxis protein